MLGYTGLQCEMLAKASNNRPSPRRRGLLLLSSMAGLVVLVVVLSLIPHPCPVELTNIVSLRDGCQQIRVPAHWAVLPREFLEDQVTTLQSADQSSRVTIMSEPKVILGQATSREQYARVVSESLRETLTAPTLLGPTTLEVNGRPAIRYVLSGHNAGPTVLILTVVDGTTEFHQILAAGTGRNTEEQRQLLLRISDTFTHGE